jgi:hypothetical protein
VEVTAEMDIVRKSIVLPEGIYSFIIRTFDKDGNISVPVEVIGRSIGDKYISGFLNRMAANYKTKGGSHLGIDWEDADNGTLYCEVVYTATDNTEKTVRALAADKTTEITDHKPETAFKYNTVYQPDPQDPLKITLPYKDVTGVYMLLDNKGLDRVIDQSSNYNADWSASHAYDGIYDHNRWASAAGYPHYVTIDMGAETTVARCGLWPSNFDGGFDNRMPSRIEWWVSTDNATWTKLGDFEFDRMAVMSERQYDVTPVTARYIKLVGLDDPAGGGLMCLGEIDVYAKLGE